MHVAVMGSGGLGGYFGARLAASGTQVSFIARGANLAAMRDHGLRIKSELGDLHLGQVTATDDPAEIGTVDCVLVMVKLYDTESAAKAIQPLIGPETGVVGFQNGMESAAILTHVLGPERVMDGVAYCPAVLEAPGVIRQSGTTARLVFGEIDGRISQRAKALEAALEQANVDHLLSDQVVLEVWKKFVSQSAFSGISAVIRRDLGDIRADPDTRALLEAALAESVAVAKAKGVEFSADDIAQCHHYVFESWTPKSRASLLQDLEIGKPLELPWLSGAVVRLGRELGVPTPTHDFITTALKLHVNGR
ncbi:MAG: 2-dehydropantoate 2-reductase [Pseudomonadota bacterium]